MLVVSSHESDQMFQITEITKRNLQKKDIIATFLARFLIIFFTIQFNYEGGLKVNLICMRPTLNLLFVVSIICLQKVDWLG